MITKIRAGIVISVSVLLIIGLAMCYHDTYKDYGLREEDIPNKVSEIAAGSEIVATRAIGSSYVVLYRQNNESFALIFEKALLSKRFTFIDSSPYHIIEGESVRMGHKNLLMYYVYDVSTDTISIIQQEVNFGSTAGVIVIIIAAAFVIVILYGIYSLVRRVWR